MGEAKRKRLGLAVEGPVVLGVRYVVGRFPMQATPGGEKRQIQVSYPKELTRQEKYDVATALARAAKVLVEEADGDAVPPKCSHCGRFCVVVDKAPEGESGDIFACSTCDVSGG